ncbi:6-phosphogluconate dehydrogenase [Erysipelothrix larvae]|uniref:6-phosphogluconate dehydrogenase, decarboxylating n=1 Tax=Erysipelothrix larvae TaxID=1514105 RepID=A0A120JTJ5_9FIRM|nr:NADP-dependent phosphogluconate dehydrogenase [Erysipelothrix larvae]AMC93062.1 6-phosphogluconate dehydrogenase [Erysipelothrix larvae]
MNKNDIGVIGMAVMGSNLALNIRDHGYEVAIYNRTTSVAEKVIEENPDAGLHMYKDIQDFVDSLSSPRKIILMVQAGRAVDLVIDQLLPLLDENDIIMDGGNSFFKDTIRRYHAVTEKKLRYLGVGISGGEEGARFGPSIMPGGSLDAYQEVASILTDISAKKDGEPCCVYLGDNGAGHYVKMVHNGIEYADMQLIAESYALLKHVGGLTNEELHYVFETWNNGELDSFLIEITAQIFKTIDPETGKHLVDVILDRAGQKGTGKWTAEEALNTGTDASLLASSVFSRFMSSQKDIRTKASDMLKFNGKNVHPEDKNAFVESVRKALYASKIIAYAQGFDLMRHASKEYGWTLHYGEIAKIFREGCIIRAKFLNKITDAYTTNPELENLLFDASFNQSVYNYQPELRNVLSLAIQNGISVPAFTNALSYYDAIRTKDSSANLIQAQRDLFGAHTFERTDKEGTFHFEWSDSNE